ncbi:MAG: hypothetical protein K2F69_05875 [Bacteroidaceae bacterium]|nr:hypothetical protein [Bacteroidaceae bacterium]
MNIKTIYPVLLASLSIVSAACGETDDLKGNPPEGALPSAEFIPSDLASEPFADDAILITTTDEGAPFYSLELLADGYYLLSMYRPYGVCDAPVGAVVDANGNVSMLKSCRRRATRSTADENGTVRFSDGTEYGKFEKTGEKEYRLSNGVTVDLLNATNSDRSIVYRNVDGSVSRVYVNVSEPAVGKGARSLCRTWRVNSLEAWGYLNGQYMAYCKQTMVDGKVETVFKGSMGIEEDDFFDDDDLPYKVIFSSSYSYICFYLDGQVDIAKWEWRDQDQGVLHYEDSKENENYDDEWGGDVSVRFAGNQMRIYEDYSYTEKGITSRTVIVNTLTAAN